MTYAGPSDALLSEILRASRTFAVIGASDNPARPSYGVMSYLMAHGYRIIPVNPRRAGRPVLGLTIEKDLASLDGPVDVVDVFRNSADALEAVRDAIREKDRLAIKTVWMQIGVVNEQAAEEASAAGLDVVMDRCPKIEHARLIGRAGSS